MKEMMIYIRCGNTVFEFPLNSENSCWFDLDGKVSEKDGETLKLNADREVYALYTDKDGTEHYGTVGDEENSTLLDNDGVEPGQRFIFYDNPKTKTNYV